MTPMYERPGVQIFHGDSLEVLREMEAGSVQAVVTDPPYELGFMGRKWDASGIASNVDLWRAVLRVLTPGGHLLAFGGTRTYHRMTCAIEDAGFEIRDSLLYWGYVTGFPKSLDVAKALDKNAGIWRGRAGEAKQGNSAMSGPNYARTDKGNPATPEAQAWQGWGTALKPAYEPIILARKPLCGTVAATVQAHGTGALNIDASRIAGIAEKPGGKINRIRSPQPNGYHNDLIDAPDPHSAGRWPANLILGCCDAPEPCEACPVAMLDGQSGVSTTRRNETPSVATEGSTSYAGSFQTNRGARGHSDTGGASRYFFVAKPSRAERDKYLDDLPRQSAGEATSRTDGSAGLDSPRAGAGRTGGARNQHPTVKPTALLRYLVKLVTPPGGTVLDLFCGSGTTGIAARLEGFEFIGVDQDETYCQTAVRRMAREVML